MQEAHDDDVSAETGTCLNEEIKKEGQKVIDVIGGHGPWQLRHWAIFFLASFCTSLQLFSTLPLISHSVCSCSKINEENNVSTSSIGCNISTRCDNRTNAAFDELSNPCFSPLPTSALEIADEENLHCTNVATVFYAKCLFVIGALIATVATYPLLNRYGRRSVSLTSCFLLCACSLAGIWAFAVGPYLILKFVISIGVTNVYLTAAFTLTDSVAEEFRLLYFYTAHVGWGLAHFILPLITIVVPSWTLYNVAITVPCFVLLVLLCFLNETPESYAARGLWPRAHSVMRKAARCNGYSLQGVEQFSPHLLIQQKEENDSNFTWKIENYRHTTERIVLFIMGFLSSFVYFTSIWLTDWLQKKRVSHFALSGTTEVAAALVLLFFAYFLPVRRMWGLAASCTSIFLIVMYSREKADVPKLSRSSYLIEMFFAATAWTLLLLHVLNQPLNSKKSKCKAITIGLGLCFGLLAAALADFQKLIMWNRSILLILSVPNLIIGVTVGVFPNRFLDCLDM